MYDGGGGLALPAICVFVCCVACVWGTCRQLEGEEGRGMQAKGIMHVSMCMATCRQLEGR